MAFIGRLSGPGGANDLHEGDTLMDSTLHSLTTRCPVCLQRLPLLAVGRPSRLGLQWRRYRAAVAGLAAIAAPVYGYAARVTGWPRVGLVAVLVVGAVAAAAWAEEKSG